MLGNQTTSELHTVGGGPAMEFLGIRKRTHTWALPPGSKGAPGTARWCSVSRRGNVVKRQCGALGVSIGVARNPDGT